MLTVGKLNREIFQCISHDISTDEVIITDERIHHIKERHPNDFEKFCKYIPEIIENPDYIIESSKENTGVILKEINHCYQKFKLILRVAIKNRNTDYKNSIISFWHIGNRTWKKTLNNKRILYKKEY